MYTKFFGLNEKPFSITPDPRYLYLSERHSEGLAHLVYGVKDSSGFIQLTGEVGTGKTTLVRTLLARIPSKVDIALILNPQLSAIEFLTAICDELNITLPKDRRSTKALVDCLNHHLLAAHAVGRRTILLIDEAQNLSTDVLEQVRLLTNLETAKQKLLQIILIAQPELRDTLSQTNLRQLAQRVTGRYHLEPLSREETALYIEHRLKVAGGLGDIFDDVAKREVYRFSGGVPRLINVICDRALLGAYSQEVRRITPQIVRKAAEEVSGKKQNRDWRRFGIAAAGIATVALLFTVVWLAAGSKEEAPPGTITVPVTTEPAEQAMPVVNANEEIIADAEAAAKLDSILQSSQGKASRDAAMATLLSLWGVEYDSSGGSVCEQAQSNGLNCLVQRGSWTVLRQLDRPVVLTLTDTAGDIHQRALVSIRQDLAELQMGDIRQSFSIDELEELWYGEYALIWQPPNGDASVLRRGSRGPKVRWLRQSLVALDPEQPATDSDSDLFDDALEQQLIDFQRRNRLETDGLAGQQTQIIINSQLGLEGTPRLSGT